MKTLHLSLIIIVVFFLFLNLGQAHADDDMYVQNIQVQPTTILVGDNFTVTATLANYSPSTIFVEHGVCEAPFSTSFDNHVHINENNITCTTDMKLEKIDSGAHITTVSPYIDLVYNAAEIGNTNATITFRYDIWNQTSQSNVEKTVSKSFQFMIYNHDTGIPSLNYVTHPVITQIDSPLKQFKSGIKAEDVKCNDGLQLIIKAEHGSPACVRKETASALILRGWASQILTAETVSQANSNQTSGDVPDFKIGPDTLRLAPHQLVFFMKSNSSAKIFVEYTSRLHNTGTMNSWSRVYTVNATNYTPLTTSDVAISASPLSIPLTEGSDTTVVYTVTAKEGIKGVYWLSLAQFCGLMPIAIDIDSSHLSPSDIPVFTGSRSCPAQMLDAKILGISGGTAEYRIGQPIP